MSGWLALLAWWALYVAVSVGVPSRKLGNGKATRLLRRVMRPRRIWRTGRQAAASRYWHGVLVLSAVGIVTPIGNASWAAGFFGSQILLLADDLLFGDDDEWRRRFEGVRNRVKWLMQVPPAPAPGSELG